METYGFFFDQSRCTGCHACTVACKNWNQLPPGPLKYLRIYQYEKGIFPHVRIHFQWIPCYHCEDPVCAHQCPTQAISKEEKYGAVLIDGEACDGCRICYDVCPYGAPFETTSWKSRPGSAICASAVWNRAFSRCVFVPAAPSISDPERLRKRYGERRDLEDLPGSQTTRPAIQTHAPKAA
jgi:anaerobic dimethyl sulfoxide reductase subunit B (iron-sulfur subunit)